MKRYVAHADSLTYGWNTSDPGTQSYPAQLAALLGAGLDGGVNYATPVATVPYPSTFAAFTASLTSGLTNGVAYLVSVRAYNASGEELNTNTASFVADSSYPANVQMLAATPGN